MVLVQQAFSQAIEEHLNEKAIMEVEDNLRDKNQSEGFTDQQLIDINNASAEDLMSINLLTPEQVKQFMLFRTTFGNFISMAELQAIPFWDIPTIRLVLPYLYIEHDEQQLSSLKKVMISGMHTIIYRTGGKKTDTLINDPGSFQRPNENTRNNHPQLLIYRFNLRDDVKVGLTVEKDVGEKKLTDHVSGYFMLNNRSGLSKLIIGDYVVNMGQGLIHWQGHSFGRSSNIIQGLKQGKIYKPHTGTDENIFHRGAAITFQKKNIELSTFFSALRIDANILVNVLSGEKTVSSILNSGLHRSESELADKNALKQIAVGSKMTWNTTKAKISLNHIRFNYDIPFNKHGLPYNKYSISGDSWQNSSIDYSWSSSIGLFFGEMAIDKRSAMAMTAGIIKSFDPKYDISLIFRNMSKDYKAIHSSTLSRQGEAGNEQGLFACFNLLPSSKIRIEGFSDHYTNLWPVYNTDGIRRGQSYAIQYQWRPDKKSELYIRWRSIREITNGSAEASHTNQLARITSNSIRLHASSIMSEAITLRYRAEIIWLLNEYKAREQGILSYAEIIIKPKRSAISISSRIAVFETDSYASRVYAYERDVMSYAAVPAHYDIGNRYYVVLHYKVDKAFQLSLKCMIMNREKQNPPYYITDYQNIKQIEWRMQLVWKIGS